MTQILTTAGKRSRFLFEWNALDSVAASAQSLAALTGQAPTFTRASIKYAADENGIYRIVPKGLPAYDWSLDPVSGIMVPSLNFEGEARTNSAPWSCDFSIAGAHWNWYGGGTITPTASCIAGQTAAFVNAHAYDPSLINTGTFDSTKTDCFSVTLTPGTAQETVIQIVDADAGNTPVAGVTVTWATHVLSAVVGTAGLVALGNGIYRLWCSIGGVTTGHGRNLVIYWAGGLPGTITGHHAQLEVGTFPSSPIVTAGPGAVTRQPDALSWALPIAPQLMTGYLNARLWQGVDASADRNLWAISPASTPSLFGRILGASNVVETVYNDGSTTAALDVATVLSYGQQLELRSVIENASGAAKLTTGVAVNGGAETTAVTTSAATFPASYPGAVLTLGGFMSLRSLRFG